MSLIHVSFHYFVMISPWKRAGPFIWTNLNPLYPRMLCAKFGWNWLSGSGQKDFYILSLYFHYFIIISPGKGQGPSFVQTWIPFNQWWIVPSLVEIGPVVLEKLKMWKVYDNNNKNTTSTDNGHILIRKAHLSLWLRWAKKDRKIPIMIDKIIKLFFFTSEFFFI